jgi:sulfate adenylyltransferase subunit 1
MDLLRIATAGSVDDGKSTLLGRLLYDTHVVADDQLADIERVSAASGADHTDLALLTDGLRAEREQGITIDVAYRYFSTHRRSFILIDTPGHVQYTRNMVTGASNADLAIVLVDARKGLVEQGRRHIFLLSLLRVPHLVLAVNKMDLVGWSEQVFEEVREEFATYATRLDVPDLTAIPMCALHGDNVVTRSQRMPWYDGQPLVRHLEEVYAASDRNLVDTRFPVQLVIRPPQSRQRDYRGYAGQVAAGVLRTGDDVLVLPSGFTTQVIGIDTADGPVDEAFPPMSVVVRLADDLDISRGAMVCRPHNPPHVTQDVEAMVCWMDERLPLATGDRLLLRHTTREVRALVRDLAYRLDTTTLHRDPSATALRLNDIGRIRLRSTEPICCDDYRVNRSTGGFILIDPGTHRTVAAGMVVHPA